MVKQPFNVERTQAGFQFVIPGTERHIPVARPQYPTDGSQLVIPGAERISGKRLLNRMMKMPLRPRVGQRSIAGTALFGSVRLK